MTTSASREGAPPAARSWTGPRRIGPYAILGRIALGGTAEVLLVRRAEAAARRSQAERPAEEVEGPPSTEVLAVARGRGAADEPPEGRLALKRLLPLAAEDPTLVERFQEGAQVALRADHARIARAWRLERLRRPGGEGAIGEPCLLMEYVAGRTLRVVWRRLVERAEQSAREPRAGVRSAVRRFLRGAPPALVAGVGVQLAEALEHLHSLPGTGEQGRGAVHGNVAPKNLVACPNGAVKLVDFGSARPIGEEGAVQPRDEGPHGYRSPEQVRGEAIDGRSDLFALGVVLWELATGHRLFPSDAAGDPARAIRAAEVSPIAESAPGFPEPVARVIHACLASSPTERPLGARRVAERLRAWLEEREVQQPEQPVADRLRQLFGPDELIAPIATVQEAKTRQEQQAVAAPAGGELGRRVRRALKLGVAWVVTLGAMSWALAASWWYVDWMWPRLL